MFHVNWRHLSKSGYCQYLQAKKRMVCLFSVLTFVPRLFTWASSVWGEGRLEYLGHLCKHSTSINALHNGYHGKGTS